MNIENEQPEIEQSLPVLKRLYLGRVAVASGLIEAAGVGVSAYTGEWAALAGASYINAAFLGGIAFNAHSYHVNRYQRRTMFVRPRPE